MSLPCKTLDGLLRHFLSFFFLESLKGISQWLQVAYFLKYDSTFLVFGTGTGGYMVGLHFLENFMMVPVEHAPTCTCFTQPSTDDNSCPTQGALQFDFKLTCFCLSQGVATGFLTRSSSGFLSISLLKRPIKAKASPIVW